MGKRGHGNGSDNPLEAARFRQTAYIVMTSNCEQWEDYHEYIESVWLSHDDAVRHIEGHLGMKQVDFRSDGKFYSRDRWEKVQLEYAERDDYEPDEWAEALAENDGEPPVVWEWKSDAWITEYPINACMEDWVVS